MEIVRCLILGSGPAGYTAAIYAGRAGLNPILYEGLQPGGQLTTTTEIENFPGYPDGVDANVMMDDMRRQALRFGVEIRPLMAVKAELGQRPFVITMDAVVDELTANRFSFELNGKLHSLPLQSIYFIESFAHIAVIHTADEEYRIRATLSELKQTLPMSRFATPHKSYLVNMAYINSVAAEDIILTNGVRVPISRRRKQDFNKDFCRFLGR